MYIEVHHVFTDEDGAPIEVTPMLINISNVYTIFPLPEQTKTLKETFNGTCIRCIGEAVYTCKESYDEIKDMLAEKEAF